MGNETVDRAAKEKSSVETDALADVFWALGDPFRLSIVEFLRSAPRTVTEITDHVDAPQPNVSRHLRALRERGVVEASRDGKWIHYSLRPGTLSLMARWIGRAGRDLDQSLLARGHGDPAHEDEKTILFID